MIVAAASGSDAPGWLWAATLVVIPLLIAVDFYVVDRIFPDMSHTAATVWAVLWFGVGVAFGVLVYNTAGRDYAVKYETGFLVEKALALDQVFVIALILRTWAAPADVARRLVWLGLVIGLAARLPFIAMGAWLAESDSLIIHLGMAACFFGGGVILLVNRNTHPDPRRSPWLRLLRRAGPVLDRFEGRELVVTDGGRRAFTLAAVILVALVTADLYFAATVPLAFAYSKPPFIVLASTGLAMLGLRSLYAFVDRIRISARTLKSGLVVILWLVAADLLVYPFIERPRWLVPFTIWAIIGVPLVVAWHRSRHDDDEPVDGHVHHDGPRPS